MVRVCYGIVPDHTKDHCCLRTYEKGTKFTTENSTLKVSDGDENVLAMYTTWLWAECESEA